VDYIKITCHALNQVGVRIKAKGDCMDINATILGQTLVVIALLIGIASYYLGRRKTQTPVLTGLIGFALGLIPLLGLIYLVVLLLKRDVSPSQAASST
jgi:hypothetical protein